MSREQAFDLNQPKFGRPITLENSTDPDSKQDVNTKEKKHILGAHAMISQFINVKLNYRDDLKDLTAGDEHAKRYFCTDDVAFIFSMDIMRAIVAQIDKKYKGKGCVIFFQGLRKSPIDPTNVKKGFAFGRPTLIATAYGQDAGGDLHYTEVEYTEYRKETATVAQAFEHPGDGTGGTSTGASLAPLADSPVVIRRCQKDEDDVCDTDFGINPKITSGMLAKWH